MRPAAADKPRREASKPSTAVKVSVNLAEKKSKKKTKKYIIGTTKDCPVQNVDVRGASFLRFSGGKPVFHDGQGPNDALSCGALRFGVFVTLTDEHVEAITDDVAQKVIRITGPEHKRRGRIWDTRKDSYAPSESDEPLARYLYMHRADSLTIEDGATGEFEPMLQE